MRGVWQLKQAHATVEEVSAVLQELHGRNVFHSQQTIIEVQREIAAKATQEAEEQKRKQSAMLMWGGVGAGIILVMVLALR